MKKFEVTMVNPQQIAQKGLKGCKTTRQVTAFAQKFNVPWTWYKPTPNYRVMLVDWPGFRTAWKENTTLTAKNTTTAHTPKNKNNYYKPATKNTYQANHKTTYRTTTTGRRTRRAA